MARFFQYNVFDDDLSKIEYTHKFIINTINPHSFCVARKDENFSKALSESDILLPDGIGIVLAIKLLNNLKIHKIAGADLHSFFLHKAANENLKVFYLGASQNTLNKIKDRISVEFPHLQISFFSPPFKPEFSAEDSMKMVSEVNSFSPDILFVGMTAPKQEKWVFANKENLNSRIICSIGAVFDFYAGTVKRPPKWLIAIGLEWLGRLVKEPKRMWSRNFVSTPLFVYHIMKEKIRMTFSKEHRKK